MANKSLAVLLGECAAFAAAAAMTAPSGTEWEDPQALGWRKEAPRSWYAPFPTVDSARGILYETSPWHLLLDSEEDWRFNWVGNPGERPKGFERPDYDVSGWPVVKVPCSWQAMGIRKSRERFGMPIYVNQENAFTPDYPDGCACWPKVTGLPLPRTWWTAANENPVGSYRRDFALPREWDGKEIFLQFDGVESFFYLWVNGRYVGYSKNSRSPAVFDVTEFVVPGRNTVAVEVYRWCDGSYLEAFDIYRLSGIHRHVRLYCRPKAYIRDARIETRPVVRKAYDGDWLVTVEAEFRNMTKEPRPRQVAAHLFAPDGRRLDLGERAVASFVRKGEDSPDFTQNSSDRNFSLCRLEFPVRTPLLWSAELPNLHTLVLELKDGGRTCEAIGFRLGFREVEIRRPGNPRDDTFLFNGRPVKLNGINRGECDPTYGHYVPDEALEADIRMIKRGNFNHIRNSHFPQGERFYDHCDRFGLYVMDEACLESHAFRYLEDSPSHDRIWEAAHWDRVEAMYEWAKNFPSVVIWSLGNEQGPGRNLRTCELNLRGRDRTRPIQCERNNAIGDLGARQYPKVDWFWKVAAGVDYVKYPYHVNEYAHNFNNNCGNLQDFQRAIESSDRIMGGALWDWADQSLYMERNGRLMMAWGGCFGELPSNGQGILDGLVTADRRPEPGYQEARRVYQPFDVVASEDGTGVLIRNKQFFRDARNVRCEAVRVADGREVGTPVEISLDVGPRSEQKVRMSLDADALRFRFVTRKAEGAYPKDWILAQRQLDFRTPRLAESVRGKARCREQGGTLAVEAGPVTYSFDRKTGELISLVRSGRELLARPVTLDAFRVPTGGESLLSRTEVNYGRRCLMAGYRTMRAAEVMQSVSTNAEDGVLVVSVEQDYRAVRREDVRNWCFGDNNPIEDLGPADKTSGRVRVRSEWRFGGDGRVAVSSVFRPCGECVPPQRLGWRMVFGRANAEIDYFALGPHDNYSDRRASCDMGRWSGRAEDFGFRYTTSQDNGTRENAYEVTVKDPGLSFKALSKPFAFAVSPYSPTELLTVSHPESLPKVRKTELGLYAKTRGLGSNNCGPLPLPEDTIRQGEAHPLSFLIAPAIKSLPYSHEGPSQG